MLEALDRLGAALESMRVASLYRSPAVSPIEQPDYLNTALVGRTELEPEELLALAKSLEWLAGRRPGPRFGPRPLDIDLLVHGELVREAAELTLPHPRLAERRFYLEPLTEVAPDLPVPPAGATVVELLAATPDDQVLTEVGWSPSEDARRLGL